MNTLKRVIHSIPYICNTGIKELCQTEICFSCQHFAKQEVLHQNLYKTSVNGSITDKNTMFPENNFKL
jgi:hypothetical protein